MAIKIKGEEIINNQKEWNEHNLLPSTDDSKSLGSNAKKWKNLYISDYATVGGSMDIAGHTTIGGSVTGSGSASFTWGVTGTTFQATNAGLSASAKVFELGSYDFYVDNTGSGTHNSRLWINGPEEGEVIIGPRGGSDYLDQFRVKAKNILLQGGQIEYGNGSYHVENINGVMTCPTIDSLYTWSWGTPVSCGSSADGWYQRNYGQAATGGGGDGVLDYRYCVRLNPNCVTAHGLPF